MTNSNTPDPRVPTAPQPGIINRPPEHLLLASFSFATTDPVEARSTAEQLRQVQRRELHSDLSDQDPSTTKGAESPETGELGFTDNYDRRHLTITIGISSTGFDKLGITTDRPQDLIPIPWAQLGDTPIQPDQGDLIVQVCSDDLFVCEHVVRRIQHELAGQLQLVWTQVGSQRYTTREGRTSRSEGRALNGFIDGTSNLDPRHSSDDAKLVFVDPGAVASYPVIPTVPPPGYGGSPSVAFPPDLRQPPASEPAWARHGTYMVVRSSTLAADSWDHATLGAQEGSVGRFKYSGAFVDLSDDPARLQEPPTFETNRADERVAVDSHVRKANPRSPEDLDRRIFRRGYPLIAADATGIKRGLVFVAFGRSISTQFEFIFRAWMRNSNFPREGAGQDRLFAFEDSVIAGGYYFVPPLARSSQPWSWILPA